MVKELALRLNQCFDPFTMLPVDGSSQTGLFRHLFTHVFRDPYFRKYISFEGHICLKIFKVWCRFWKCTKKSKKKFCFCDKYIWIVYIELSLLRREYLSSAVIVLTKSKKTLHVSKSDSFRMNYLQSDQWIR